MGPGFAVSGFSLGGVQIYCDTLLIHHFRWNPGVEINFSLFTTLSSLSTFSAMAFSIKLSFFSYSRPQTIF